MMSDKISFIASLPPIQSAWKLGGGEGDGARLQLDIPGTDITEAVRLLTMRGRTFRVIIEEDE